MKTRYFVQLGVLSGVLSVSAITQDIHTTKSGAATAVPAVVRTTTSANGSVQQNSAAHATAISYLIITPKAATRARIMHAQTVHRGDQNMRQRTPLVPNFPDSNTETGAAKQNNTVAQPQPNTFTPPPRAYANYANAVPRPAGTNVLTNSSSKTNTTETARSEGPKVLPLYEANGPAYNDSDPLLGYQREQAEKGNPESQYAIGLRYLNGVGVEQNDVLAREWLEKASAGGNLRARAKLRELNAPIDLTK
jgi:hypothetical protein